MTNNTHFSNLFTDDIYILDNKDISNNSNPETVDNLIEEPKNEYVAENKVEETTIQENNTTIEQPVTDTKDKKVIEKHKFDESKIYIFCDYEISKPEKQFLAKILKAAKVDLYSIKVEKWDSNAKEYNGKNFVFNTQITDCGLTGKRISAPPLHEIEQNVALKKVLWENMQKVFL